MAVNWALRFPYRAWHNWLLGWPEEGEGERATDETAHLLLRMLTFSGKTASKLHWHVAPYDSEMALKDSSQGILIAEVCGWELFTICGVCAPLMDICAIFVWIFLAVYYSVYVATSPEARSTEVFPFFPWHIFALREKCSFHQGVRVCVCVCACFIQNCEYLFTSTLKSQESLGQCECVYTCTPCMCTHAGSRGQGSGGATCDGIDRHVLCT